MGKGWTMLAATVVLASAIGLLMGWGAREGRVGNAVPMLVAKAPEAGLIAIAGPVPGRIRVLYARNSIEHVRTARPTTTFSLAIRDASAERLLNRIY